MPAHTPPLRPQTRCESSPLRASYPRHGDRGCCQDNLPPFALAVCAVSCGDPVLHVPEQRHRARCSGTQQSWHNRLPGHGRAYGHPQDGPSLPRCSYQRKRLHEPSRTLSSAFHIGGPKWVSLIILEKNAKNGISGETRSASGNLPQNHALSSQPSSLAGPTSLLWGLRLTWYGSKPRTASLLPTADTAPLLLGHPLTPQRCHCSAAALCQEALLLVQVVQHIPLPERHQRPQMT